MVLSKENDGETNEGEGGEETALSVVPLYSWYHAGWDTEPDLQDETYLEVERALPFSRKWGDFSMCTWPGVVDQLTFCSTSTGGGTGGNDNPPGAAAAGGGGGGSTALAEAWASLNEPFLPPLPLPSPTAAHADTADTADSDINAPAPSPSMATLTWTVL